MDGTATPLPGMPLEGVDHHPMFRVLVLQVSHDKQNYKTEV